MATFSTQQFGDLSSFFQALYSARQPFLQQQQSLLTSLGPALRNAILGASPELAQAQAFMSNQFANPIPKDLEQDYAERIRTAQSARGFGGGGTGVAGEEARFLQGAADQRRMSLLSPMMGLGQNLLGISGLQGPPNLDFASIASAMLGANRLSAETAAGRQQSQFAQQMYNDMLRGRIGGGGSSMGGGAGGFAGGGFGGGGFGNAGDYSSIGYNPFDINSFVGVDPYSKPWAANYEGSPGAGANVSSSFNGIPLGGAPVGPPALSASPVGPPALSAQAPTTADNWAGTGHSYDYYHKPGAWSSVG